MAPEVYILTPYDPRRARTNQISDMVTAYGYATVACKVTLVAPSVYLKGRLQKRAVFEAYGLPEVFQIRYLPVLLLDSMPGRLGKILLRIAHLVYGFFLMIRILASRQPVLILSKDALLLSPYLAFRRILPAKNIRIVYWAHELLDRPRERWVLGQINACLATNQAIVDDLKTVFHFPEERVLLVSNPIREELLSFPELSKPELRARLNLPPDRPLIVYTGKIYSGQAEIEHLLSAAGRMPEALFVFTGGKPEVIAGLNARCRETNSSNIVFTGFLDEYKSVRDYQQAADILVSYYSAHDHLVRYNFPNKMLEYFSSGNPVATADHPALRPFCHAGNCVLVEPDNPEALRTALSDLLHDQPRRKQLGEAGRQTARDWTTEKVAGRILGRLFP